MCGILIASGKYDVTSLNLSLNKISHRGPDATSHVTVGGVYMGHTRLAIIDLSPAGNQPMTSHCGRYTIVFNGEIYNFEYLKKELSDNNFIFKTNSDTEVILALYSIYKDKLLKKLNGIFSFVIFDSFKNVYFVARDAMGVKPLYYYKNDDILVFSSELKAITDYIDKLIDVDAIKKYLTYMWCPGERTAYKNVFKFPPGGAAYCRNTTILKLWKWYFSSIKYKISSEENIIQDSRKLIKSAVENQLIADVPVGAFLSGGVDSSSIVYFASQIKPDLECFTIRTNDNNSEINSDFHHAKILSDKLNLNLNSTLITENDILDNIYTIVYHMDEPICDPAAFNTFFISKLASNLGIKVMLSGTGGDDIFTGYRRHDAIAFKNKYNSFLNNPLSNLLMTLLKTLISNNKNLRRLSKLLDVYTDRNGNYLPKYFHWINHKNINLLFKNNFLIKNEYESLDDEFNHYLNEISYLDNDLDKCLLLEQNFFLPDHNLIYSDKMSMAHGVELRVPFLDPHLVSYANSIPLDIKYKNFHSKHVLKSAMIGMIPDTILNRKKVGFGLPLRSWLNNGLYPLVEKHLSKNEIEKYNIFNYQEIDKLIRSNKNNKIDASYTIFSLVICQIWFDLFIGD